MATETSNTRDGLAR